MRELAHVVERAVLLAAGELIGAGDLGLARGGASEVPNLEELSLEDVERVLIQKALKRFDGNLSRAASALGLSRAALYRRLAKHQA